jgi:hypothetical protein
MSLNSPVKGRWPVARLVNSLTASNVRSLTFAILRVGSWRDEKSSKRTLVVKEKLLAERRSEKTSPGE